MPESKVSNQQMNPQLGGIAARNQNQGGNNRGQIPPLIRLREIAKQSSLNEVLGTWLDRARSGATIDLIKLKDLSTRVRYRQPIKATCKGTELDLGHDGTEAVFLEQAEEAEQALQTNLDDSFGRADKENESLMSTFKSALSTLRMYSRHQATEADVDKSVRRFANLKMFLEYGGNLHSTTNVRKLERTIEKIPKNVLKNASPHVTYKTYAKAEHRRYETGTPLLSFHRGFKVTNNFLGKSRRSRAYRQNLRAITASALILGGHDGHEKALKVKELLTEINKHTDIGYLEKKEDVVQRVLENLDRHCDVDALIEDLVFARDSYKLTRGLESAFHFKLSGLPVGITEEDYRAICTALSKLRDSPDCMAVLQNVLRRISDNCPGYKLTKPTNVRRDLEFAVPDDPFADCLGPNPGKPDRARNAIAKWAEVMSPWESKERDALALVLNNIENDVEDPTERARMYSDAARAFSAIYRRAMSPGDQSLLLMSCLISPNARRSEHLGYVNFMKKRLENKQDIDDDIKQDIAKNIRRDGKGKARKDKIRNVKNEVKSEVKFDNDKKIDNDNLDKKTSKKKTKASLLDQYKKSSRMPRKKSHHKPLRNKFDPNKVLLEPIEEEPTTLDTEMKIEESPRKEKNVPAEDEPPVKDSDKKASDNVADDGGDDGGNNDIKADNDGDGDHSDFGGPHVLESAMGLSGSAYVNQDTNNDDDDYSDGSDPDGGDELKQVEITKEELYQTPGDPEPKKKPENSKQED